MRELISKKAVLLYSFGFVLGLVLLFWNYFGLQQALYPLLKYFCVFIWLLPIGYIDWKRQIIPNLLVLIGLAVFVLFSLVDIIGFQYTFGTVVKTALSGMLFGGGTFLFCSILSKGGMGAGDVKLYAVLGLLLGFNGVFTVMFISILLVAVYGIISLVCKKIDKKSMIPIGPFTLLGMFLSMFLGI